MSYSIQKLIATCLCLAGVIFSIAGAGIGGWLLGIGFVWFVIVRIMGDTVK